MQQYGKEAVKEIIKAYLREWAVIDDSGVRLSNTCLEYDPTQTLHWKFACELEGSDAPDPLEAPCLPIPCSANQLAAFMLDGIGAVLPTIYGDWANGPYQSILDGMGILANKPRDALKGAYQAYRDAEAVVGKMDATLEIQKYQLAEELEQKNEEANAREGVFTPNVSEDDRRASRRRAQASIARFKVLSDNADAAYQAAFKVWRKAMANQLLSPHVPVMADETPAGEVASSTATWTEKRKAEARSMVDRLRSEGKHNFRKLTAEHFGVSPQRLDAVLKDSPVSSLTKRLSQNSVFDVKSKVHKIK